MGDKPCVLGVDEAGRGPVMGPMVYAVAYSQLDRYQELTELGFDDSKVLKEQQRDDFFNEIQDRDWIGWGVHTLSPQDISASMLARF